MDYNAFINKKRRDLMKKNIRKSIMEMLMSIDDVGKLERVHRFIEYIYVSK